MYLCVRGIDFPSFYDFDIVFFWNLSDILLCFVCHFIRKIGGKEKLKLPLEIQILVQAWKFLPNTGLQILFKIIFVYLFDTSNLVYSYTSMGRLEPTHHSISALAQLKPGYIYWLYLRSLSNSYVVTFRSSRRCDSSSCNCRIVLLTFAILFYQTKFKYI